MSDGYITTGNVRLRFPARQINTYLDSPKRIQRRKTMPDKETIARVREDAREGRSPSTQAGEFVREEIDHVREGMHGAASTKQAIAIGLSKARRAGVELQTPRKGQASEQTIKQAKRDARKGRSHSAGMPSANRSRATVQALKKEGHRAASH